MAELEDRGYCILEGCFSEFAVRACREAFWPTLLKYLEEHRDEPNRGPNRHFLPMPFDPPSFAPEFFFNAEVLGLVRRSMDERIVADQWGCDAPLKGSTIRNFMSITSGRYSPKPQIFCCPPTCSWSASVSAM
jgi:hypothetical protein